MAQPRGSSLQSSGKIAWRARIFLPGRAEFCASSPRFPFSHYPFLSLFSYLLFCISCSFFPYSCFLAFILFLPFLILTIASTLLFSPNILYSPFPLSSFSPFLLFPPSGIGRARIFIKQLRLAMALRGIASV